MLVLCREPDRLNEGKNKPFGGRSLSGEAFSPQPAVSIRAVLQLVVLDARVRQGGVGQQTSNQLNQRLLSTLKAGHQLNTSRLQLLNVLDVQTSLERLLYVARARNAGMPAPEMRKLEQCMTEVRRAVSLAGEAWNQAGPAFTRLTRLLPVQLEEAELCFTPMESAEIERLARFCALSFPGVQAPSIFLQERERCQKAAVDVVVTTASVSRTGDVLRLAENGFRVGARDAHEFASALIEHNQQRRELMQRTLRACVARYTLYAMAQRLPEQLGLL